MSNKLVQEWLKKAEDDELNARSILTHKDGTPGAVCFLSQQCVEKNLKSLLVYQKIHFPKVHDLTALEGLLLEIYPEINVFEDNLKDLSRYYIETRYPGDYPEFSWSDAEEAFAIAKRVKEFVATKI